MGFGGKANDVPAVVEVDASVGHVVVTVAALGWVVVWADVLTFNKEGRTGGDIGHHALGDPEPPSGGSAVHGIGGGIGIDASGGVHFELGTQRALRAVATCGVWIRAIDAKG